MKVIEQLLVHVYVTASYDWAHNTYIHVTEIAWMLWNHGPSKSNPNLIDRIDRFSFEIQP
jgi:hypothetical protein